MDGVESTRTRAAEMSRLWLVHSVCQPPVRVPTDAIVVPGQSGQLRMVFLRYRMCFTLQNVFFRCKMSSNIKGLAADEESGGSHTGRLRDET